MTGAYLRVQRDGKWQSVEIEYLTEAEREVLFKDRSVAELIRWLNVTCEALASIESGIEPA